MKKYLLFHTLIFAAFFSMTVQAMIITCTDDTTGMAPVTFDLASGTQQFHDGSNDFLVSGGIPAGTNTGALYIDTTIHGADINSSGSLPGSVRLWSNDNNNSFHLTCSSN